MTTDTGTNTGSGNSVQVEPSTASGTNSTASTTATIVQYPKPPRRDDGKWLAIGSMVGSLFGMMYSADIIKKAKAAEDKWKDLTDHFYDRGTNIETWADTLRDCDDKLHTALCKFAMCGYTADYTGILRRARQAAQMQVASAYRTACRTANRYNVGLNSEVYSGLLQSGVMAVVQASTLAIEAEREKAWQLNWEVLAKTTQIFESDFLQRNQLSANYLMGAGENYGFLAQSYRATAKADNGDMAALGAMLGVLLPIAFGFGCSSADYCGDGCSSGTSTVTPTTPTTTTGTSGTTATA